ncbi:hypothetical protein LMG32289_03625 [Cupriavidus pampae]|uniref:Uncharacterized protein n=1 Tax=Cupriavidus pampae TaxID=659251 RepID=A0ABM8X9U4_9BURK|nr:hypothetical protein LMG32289_03625 [Cupriavidus pampae]
MLPHALLLSNSFHSPYRNTTYVYVAIRSYEANEIDSFATHKHPTRNGSHSLINPQTFIFSLAHDFHNFATKIFRGVYGYDGIHVIINVITQPALTLPLEMNFRHNTEIVGRNNSCQYT